MTGLHVDDYKAPIERFSTVHLSDTAAHQPSQPANPIVTAEYMPMNVDNDMSRNILPDEDLCTASSELQETPGDFSILISMGSEFYSQLCQTLLPDRH
jgi:hypothetical protein